MFIISNCSMSLRYISGVHHLSNNLPPNFTFYADSESVFRFHLTSKPRYCCMQKKKSKILMADFIKLFEKKLKPNSKI